MKKTFGFSCDGWSGTLGSYGGNYNYNDMTGLKTKGCVGNGQVEENGAWPRRDITNLVGSEHLLTTVVMVMTMTVTADELREGRHGQKLKKDKKKNKRTKEKRNKSQII